MANRQMTEKLTDLDQPESYGPAMMALNERQRKFVVAYVLFTDCNATEAARAAGYSDKGRHDKPGIRREGHRLVHNPAVGLAIRELALSHAASESPKYLRKLAQIALKDDHKDQVPALKSILNRIGLQEAIDRNINVNVTITTEQKVAEIRQMAEELGLDPQVLLGNVSDAEFTDVSTAEAAP